MFGERKEKEKEKKKKKRKKEKEKEKKKGVGAGEGIPAVGMCWFSGVMNDVIFFMPWHSALEGWV
jgi:hypothetical protein